MLSATGSPRTQPIVDDLLVHGFSIRPSFYTNDEVGHLSEVLEARWRSGVFRQAGIGRGDHFQRNAEIRQDFIHWLEAPDPNQLVNAHLDFIEDLRIAINQTFFMGLFSFEGHFAVYPAGAFYRKHLDCFLQLKRRLVTVIVYLNQDWTEEDGGQLRMYMEPGHPVPHIDIYPNGGTLVVFASDRFYHEVLPGRKQRRSLTGWLCRRV